MGQGEEPAASGDESGDGGVRLNEWAMKRPSPLSPEWQKQQQAPPPVSISPELSALPVRRPIRTHGRTSPMVFISERPPVIGAKWPEWAAVRPADLLTAVVATRLAVNNAAGICR